MLPLKVCIEDFTFEPANIDLKEEYISHDMMIAMLRLEIQRRISNKIDNQGLLHINIVRTRIKPRSSIQMK